MQARVWRLGEGLTLIDPQGVTVAVPYRKVAELLSLLAESPDFTADREELARRLWPDSLRTDRLTNLRQCIARMRAILPEGAVHSDRLRCSLSPDFRIEATAEQAGRESASPALESLVLWYARHDPALMFETLRVSPESGLAMDKTSLGMAIRLVSAGGSLSPRDRAWWHLFRGVSQFSSSLRVSSTSLSAAAKQAEAIEDLPLLELALYWQGVTFILSRRMGEADRFANRASCLFGSKAGRPSKKIEDLCAHVLLHQGDTDGALKRLELSSEMAPDGVADQMADKTLRALYLAFEGRRSEAVRLLDEVGRISIPPGASRANIYANLAAAYLEAEDSDATRLGKLKDQVREFAAAGERHMEIYTREGLAVLMARKGRLADARQEISASHGLRAQIDLAYTAWDLGRLSEVRRQGLLPAS